MVEKYALYSGALIKIAGSGHIDGAYVSAKDYHKLESALAAANERIAELEAEIDVLNLENKQLDVGLERLSKAVSEGNKTIAQLLNTSENARLVESVSNLKGDCIAYFASIEAYKEENARLRAEVERLTALVQEHQTYTPKQSIKVQP